MHPNLNVPVLSQPLLWTASALLTTVASAQTLQVPGQFATIQHALSSAPPGAVIEVAAGTYSLVSPLDPAGKALTVRGIGSVVLDGGGASRLLVIQRGETLTTRFENLRFTGGAAPSGGGNGGAVLLRDSSAYFEDCRFDRCLAGRGRIGGDGGRGGAVYLSNSAARFDRCIFDDNAAGEGGVGRTGSTGANGTNGNVQGGVGGPGGPGGHGGDGGAVAAVGTGAVVTATFTNCLFTDNAPGRGGDGGTGGAGGNGYVVFGNPIGIGGTGGDGGSGGNGGEAAVWVGAGGSLLDFINCTFHGNYPAHGGDRGDGGAGGAGLTSGSPGSPGNSGQAGLVTSVRGYYRTSLTRLFNSVHWDRQAPPGGGSTLPTTETAYVFVAAGAGRTLPASLIQLTADPLDVSYRPLSGSPLVDAADPGFLDPALTLDVTGGERRFDYPAVSGVLDIGAIELRSPLLSLVPCTLNPSGAIQHVAGQPELGGSFTVEISDSTSSISPNSLGMLLYSPAPTPAACGVPTPSLGMVPGTQGYVHLAQPEFLAAGIYPGPGLALPIVVGVPSDPNLMGLQFWLQGALVDTVNQNIGLTGALEGLVGGL